MKILLTNDDGIRAPGLLALHQALIGDHEVVVVAPDRERSAVGHGITLHDPLRITPAQLNGHKQSGFAVDGTPADCVKLALGELLAAPPEVVISGINPGANVGVDINYSGTVAAAREAALMGIPAVAVSMIRPGAPFFADGARFVASLLTNINSQGLPPGTFLNVNLPHCALDQVAGVRLSPQSLLMDHNDYEKRTDPRERAYYWLRGYGKPKPRKENLTGDRGALVANYISVTPIKCDMTDYDFMTTLDQWNIVGE